MIKAFAGNIVFVLILIPVLIATNLTFEYFFNAFNPSDLHLTNLLNKDLTPTVGWLNTSLVIIILTVNAVLINFTFNSHEFYDRNTYLPSLIYVIIVCFFPLSIYVNGELLAQTFAILAINQLFLIRQNEDARKWMFNAAFFIGLAYIFNPVYFIYFIVLFIVLLNIRPFVVREFILGGLGFIIPLLWLFLYRLLIESSTEGNFIINSLIEHKAYLDFDHLPYWVIISPHLLIIPLFTMALYYLSKRFGKSSIRFKRLIQNTVFLTLSAAFISITLFVSVDSYYYFSVGATILPLIIPYAYLESKNKTLSLILIYLLLLLHIVKFIF
jgi:hypothetical protein